MSEKINDKMMIPEYVKNFSCIGTKCEDTCCAGWSIQIDEETYNKYKKVKHPVMKTRLQKELVAKRSNATKEYAAKIKLKNGRCAFLSQEGLCDLYSTLGEQYLSSTCHLYPRTINKINDEIECSLICSCPEAARQILLLEDKISFKEEDMPYRMQIISADITINSHRPQKWQDYFFALRKLVIDMLQDRTYRLEERFIILEAFMKQLENCKASASVKKIPELIKRFNEKTRRQEIVNRTADDVGDINYYAELAKMLNQLESKKKLKSKRYEECLNAALTGLEAASEDSLMIGLRYQEGCEKYLNEFMCREGKMLEHYFVNYVFERCFPLEADSPLESFRRMKLYKQLIELQLAGMSLFYKELTQELVIKLVQSFSKTFDHDDETLAPILAFDKKDNKV